MTEPTQQQGLEAVALGFLLYLGEWGQQLKEFEAQIDAIEAAWKAAGDNSEYRAEMMKRETHDSYVYAARLRVKIMALAFAAGSVLCGEATKPVKELFDEIGRMA